MIKQTQYDETFFVALHSLDLGDIHSPDGRAHPLTAMTPVSVVEHASDAGAGTVEIAPTVLPAGTATGPSFMPSLPSLNPKDWIPQHFGARLAVGVVAVGLLLIVAWRLSK